MRPLAVAVGDPAGVGPVVSARAAVELADRVALVLYGDAARMGPLLAGAPAREVDPDRPGDLPPGTLGLATACRWSPASVDTRAPTPEGGRAQLAQLDRAAAAVRSGACRALVTGPVSKEAVTLGGTPFTGQTEHLARDAGLAADGVTMMFLGPRLRVALVTTHLPLRRVADEVRDERVVRTVLHLVEALAALGVDAPRVAVTGLNPHAGEGGLLGAEEAAILAPAVATCRLHDAVRQRSATVIGPRSAEAALREAIAGRHDGIVALYHDQATIASKLVDFGAAVNVTWGLPYVRTSVDHGVAYDAAAAGTADPSGMKAAIRMAVRLVEGGGSRE